MFLRTYSPAIDRETERFKGFQAKASNFEEGCSVFRVGSVREGPLGPDTQYSEIYAVEFDGKCFLFRVESEPKKIGEIGDIRLVSAGVWICSKDPTLTYEDSSLDKSSVRPDVSIAYEYASEEQRAQALRLLHEGVRRLNFSFDGERAALARPIQFFSEFKIYIHGEAQSSALEDSDLATLLQMRSHTTGFRALEAYGVKTKDSAARALVSNAEKVEQLIAERQQERLGAARLWIEKNDQPTTLKRVSDILNDPNNASNRKNLEWVLAQAARLVPPVSIKYEPIFGVPSALEQLLSEVWFQDICRAIYEERFHAFFPSFEAFFTKLIFTLAKPLSNHEMLSRISDVKTRYAAAAKRNAESARRFKARQKERWKFWKVRNWF